jgi:hypothetical protein
LAVVALVAKADFVSTPAATWAIYLAKCLAVVEGVVAVVNVVGHSEAATLKRR